MKSFDSHSDLEYLWEIQEFGSKPIQKHDVVFYHKFEKQGRYNIKLTVTNRNNKSESETREIQVHPKEISKKIRSGNLNDNKDFNLILQNRKILCEIVYGVIDGPQLHWDKTDIEKWKRGNISESNQEIIDNALEFNKHICDIVDKCIRKYSKKRILIFTNGVTHAQNLALILHVKYNLKAKSVDSNMNPGLRRQVISDFREGQINALCNHGILTTGFDVPEIDTLLICRTVGSNALYTQMIGRGQRGLLVGGTEKLWLITSHFKKGEYENDTDLRLGWEALVDTWQKFDPEIKEDLKVRDNIENETVSIGPKKPEINPSPQIISLEPLRLRCMTCHVEREGVENMVEWFGVEGKAESIPNEIERGTFPKNCKVCRSLKKIVKYSKCDFCKSFVENHNYDPIFIMITKFAQIYQKEKQMKKFRDLQNYLYSACQKNIPLSYFELNNPTIKKMVELGLLKIKENLELEFKTIVESETLEKLLPLLYHAQETRNNLDKILSTHRNLKSEIPSSSNELKTVFYKLKNQHGHIPTRRQFNSAVHEDKNLGSEFKQNFNANYRNLLNLYDEIIRDDNNLKDALYDEYFEKCIRVRRKISKDELDEYGEYRISDYEDVFGSFEKLEEKIAINLQLVLDNVDQKLKESDKEFEEIGNDFKKLKLKLGRFPHFEDIRIHSEIGVYRYLIQMKISYLRYLKNYDGEHVGAFLRLVKGFFKLRDILEMNPTSKQFAGFTSAETTAGLGKIFNFNYDRFLKTIGIQSGNNSINSKHEEQMREKTLRKLKEIKEKHGKEKLFEILDSAKNNDDYLSISIRAWFPDLTRLKRECDEIIQNTSP